MKRLDFTIVVAIIAYVGILICGTVTKVEAAKLDKITTAEVILSSFMYEGLECKNVKEEKSSVPGITRVIKADKFTIYEFNDIESANKFLPKEGYENKYNFRSIGNIQVYVWSRDPDEIKTYLDFFKNFMN